MQSYISDDVQIINTIKKRCHKDYASILYRLRTGRRKTG